MIYLQEVVVLNNFKDVIHTYRTPLPSVNDVLSYLINHAIPNLVKQKRLSFTSIRTLDMNSSG